MELGAFIAPSSGFIDTYSEANFNSYNIVWMQSNFVDDAAVEATKNNLNYAMSECEKYGIGAQIQLHHDLLSYKYNIFTTFLPDIDFKDYPAFQGFYMCDEPTWGNIETLDKYYVDWFNENYGGEHSQYEFYVNMLGGYSSAIGAIKDADGNYVLVNGQKIYDGTAEQKRICYDYYVEQFLNMFARVKSSKKFFTIDAYPLMDNQVGLLTLPEDGYVRYIPDTWLATNYKAALNAKNNSYAFGAFVQTCDEGGATSSRKFRLPTTVEEIKWQAYINIAFGAKKLAYYGYDNRAGGTYMTLNGNPLDLYYFVQETNAEIDKFDNVIMAFSEWVGVKTFLGSSSQSNTAFDNIASVELSSLTGVKNVSCSRDLIVGEMIDKNGNHGYMMVGYDDPYNKNTTEVSLNFEGAEGLIIYRNGERELSNTLTDGNFNITLNAGEGVFVIPVYAE